MEAAEAPNSTSTSSPTDESPVWTYPTRFCRICREDVPATVTMYPPGLPVQFQKPIVEYRNEDEYGRLIKPCMCRGSSRYIHELCLLRSRTENTRSNSMWKCHECGYKFNFNKLTVQRYLSSKITIAILTVFAMVFIVFILGFVADPIINIYMDPYDSITGRESIWEELQVRSAKESRVSAWAQHFTKGVISMGLVGFMKTLFLNPFQWINVRVGGSWATSHNRSATGRDRAVNISWIAVMIGVSSAFVFFYRWMQAIVQRSMQRIGNNIVDTQLPNDDDDLKPPAGWKPSGPATEIPAQDQVQKSPSKAGVHSSETQAAPSESQMSSTSSAAQDNAAADESIPDQSSTTQHDRQTNPVMSGSWIDVGDVESHGNDTTPLAGVHRQGWSFSNI